MIKITMVEEFIMPFIQNTEIVYQAPEYYNPNYEPYVPYYPDLPYVFYPQPTYYYPPDLWPLLQELTEIKDLLKQILDNQGGIK